MTSIQFGSMVYSTPYADVLPPLTAEEYAALREDIRANGVRVSVVVTEDDVIIDGHNRVAIAAELGLTDVPFTLLVALTADQRRAAALDLNLHRRHLTRDQRRDLVAAALKANPSRSNRAVAAETKVDDKTVAAVRDRLESTAEIPQLPSTTGKDGRSRPAKRPAVATRSTPASPPASAEAAADVRPEVESEAVAPVAAAKWPDLDLRLYWLLRFADDLKKERKARVADRCPARATAKIRRMRNEIDELERIAANLPPATPPNTPNPRPTASVLDHEGVGNGGERTDART